jgi:putative heme transporter
MRDGGEPRDLAGLFAAPRWLRDFGTSAWLAVGVVLFVAATVAILALTRTIVMPVIAAAVVAAVASPLVRRFERRGIGAALLVLAMIVLAAAVVALVLGAITSQLDALRGDLSAAKDTIAGWLADSGVDRETAVDANENASSALSAAVPALLEGVVGGVEKLSSLVVFLSLTVLSLFFLLKDGPLIRHWAEGHMRVPRPVAHQIGDRVLQSLRG